jgi:hypothetical protein
MATASFQKNSLSWQLRQLGQQVKEWIELQTSKISPRSTNSSNPGDLPQIELATWVGEVIFWLVVSLAVAWIVWQLYRAFSPYFSMLKAQSSWFKQQRASAKPADPTAADWLRRAREQQQQGNYREACRAIYLATLQRLNDTQQIPHQTSRTDGEYLRMVQRLPRTEPYQVLFGIHERLCFGDDANISATTVERCQQAYQEIAEP